MTTSAPPRPISSIRDPRWFLQRVPLLAQCTPRNSLVLVPFVGPQASGALRLDLPCPDDARGTGLIGAERAMRAAIDNLAATAVGMVCRMADADGIAVVAYDSREPWPPDGPLPQEPLVDRVLDCADACGLRVYGAYLVAQNGWGAYGDTSAPAPLSQIVPEAEAALAHDQHEGCALPLVPAEECAAIAERLLADEARFTRWLARRRSTSPVDGEPAGTDGDERVEGEPVEREPDEADGDEPGRPGIGDRLASLDEDAPGPSALDALPELFERAQVWNPAHLDADDATRLALVCEMPILRDVMLVQWAGDIGQGRECLAWQLQWRPGTSIDPADVPAVVRRISGEGPRPDAARLRHGIELLRRVAAAAPPRAQAGALAACAWLSWALGHSTHAAHYIEAALEREPEHSFARLLEQLVVATQLPAWVFRPSGEGSPLGNGRMSWGRVATPDLT